MVSFNSNQGNTLRTKYNNAIAGIKPEQKDIQQNVIDKDISNQTPQVKEYDKTVIEPISKQFEKEPIKAWGNLVNIIKGFDKTEATPQQIYNTLLDLYKNLQEMHISLDIIQIFLKLFTMLL